MSENEPEGRFAGLAGLSISHVAVDRELFEKAKAGDKVAVLDLRNKLHGLFLYDHMFPVMENEQIVTIFDLGQIGVIDKVRFEKSIMTWMLEIEAP